MAKFEITRKCGHNETVAIFGKQDSRESRADWEATRLCRECYLAEQAQKREEEAKAATEHANAAGLPELAGTEKQVAWANKIRAEIMEAMAAWIREAKADISQEAVAASLVEIMSHETEARYWIENREITWRNYLRSHLEAVSQFKALIGAN